MDVLYLASVLQRRLRLLALLATVGVILGGLVYVTYPKSYEARAILLIQPPQNAAGGTVWTSDPDRYVIGQRTVLESPALAEQVASGLRGVAATDITNSTAIVQEPKTDVVSVVVTRPQARQAQKIANAIAQSYLSDLRDRAARQQGPLVKEFDDRLKAIRSDLKSIEIAAEAKRIEGDQASLRIAQAAGSPNAAFIEEQQRILNAATEAAGELAADRQAKLAEYASVLQIRLQLQLSENQKVASEIIQSALAPRAPAASPAKLVALGLSLGVPLMGAALLVLQAAFSNRVVVEGEVEDALGAPLAGDLPTSLVDVELDELLAGVPVAAAEAIDQLCVRAEANATDPDTLTVVVVGTQKGQGGTRLAVAMASRFAYKGASVVLVDADQGVGRLTRAFGATAYGGIPTLLAKSAIEQERGAGSARGAAKESSASGLQRVFTPTVLGSALSILGLGPKVDQPAFRRSDVGAILEAAKERGHVVIVDAGTMLDSAASLQFTRDVDAVVITVPTEGQERAGLAAISVQLRAVRHRLLPVMSSVTERAELDPAVMYPGADEEEPASREPATAGRRRRNG